MEAVSVMLPNNPPNPPNQDQNLVTAKNYEKQAKPYSYGKYQLEKLMWNHREQQSLKCIWKRKQKFQCCKKEKTSQKFREIKGVKIKAEENTKA